MIQRIRVPLGFVFALVYIFFADPSGTSLSCGVGIGLIGIALRIWAAGHLRKHQELSTEGPYRWTRNPLYLGSFLIGLGLTIAAHNLWLFLLFTGLFFVIYLPVMKREEEELIEAYSSQYREYRNSVPLFLPTLKPGPNSATSNFGWDQVILNREYNAAVGFALILLLLLWKLFF